MPLELFFFIDSETFYAKKGSNSITKLFNKLFLFCHEIQGTL